MDSPFLDDDAYSNIGELSVKYHKNINCVLKECFGETREYDYDKIHFGKFDLVSYLNVTPRAIVLDGEIRKVGHICSVSTLEVFRGRGYAEALLNETLNWLREHDFYAAALHADNPTLYENAHFQQAPRPRNDIMVCLLVDSNIDVFSKENMEEWVKLDNTLDASSEE